MGRILTLNIPDSVQLSPFELRMTLAARLFERGLLSSGQAADLAGISKRAFVELLSKYEVSVFGYESLEEIESDLRHGRVLSA